MARPQKDILVEIPDDHLNKLGDFYAERAPWAPQMVSFIQLGFEWKQLEKYQDCIVFYSPNNCWEQDGTVIIVVKLFVQEIYLYTLDEHCTNLERGLLETNLIRYDNRRTVFYATNDKYIPIVRANIKARKLNVHNDLPCFLYALPPEDAKRFTAECPPDVYIRRLRGSDATQIDRLWPHRFRDSDKYIASFLDFHAGYGIFLKSTNQMVAWFLRHAFGIMTILQVEEEHQRKGYASLVTKVLAKEIAEEGYFPTVTAIKSNESANGLFKQLGFKAIEHCTFIVIE